MARQPIFGGWAWERPWEYCCLGPQCICVDRNALTEGESILVVYLKVSPLKMDRYLRNPKRFDFSDANLLCYNISSSKKHYQ